MFINLASVFIRSGFSTALIQKKDADATDFSTMFICSQACSLAIYGILYFAAPLVADFYRIPQLAVIMRVLSLQIPLGVYSSIQTAYVSRHMLFRKVFYATFVNTLISGAAGITLALMGAGVWALVAQTLMATLVNSVMLTLLLPWRPRWIFSRERAKSLMSYGSRVLAADLSGDFFYELRSIIIGRVYTGADLAFYNKGQQIPLLITNNLSNMLNTVMFPAIANHSDDLVQAREMVRRSMRILGFILFPCMLGLSAVMEPLILLLFTDKWAAAIPYGRILSISASLNLVANFSLYVLKAIGRSEVVLGLEFRKKPVYVVAILLGVRHSVLGLAAAVLCYDFFELGINFSQLRKHIHYSGREQLQDLLPSALLALTMAAAVFLLPSVGGSLLTLAVKVAAGAAVYVAGAVIFRLDAMKNILDLLKNLPLFRKK